MIIGYLWNLFIHNVNGGLISGRGYQAKVEGGIGQETHGNVF